MPWEFAEKVAWMSQCSEFVATEIDPFSVQLNPSPEYEQLLKFQLLELFWTQPLSPMPRADASGLGTGRLFRAASGDGTAASALLGSWLPRSSASRAAAVGSAV